MGVIAIVLTPGRSVAFQIMVVAGTGSDFCVILRTFAGRVIGITLFLAILRVFVDVHINIALHDVFVHTVGQKTNSGKSGGGEKSQ